MKISCEWSQQDWDKALKKVWKLARNFDEILEFGLENGFITNSDIIHASDIYKDPNKEYDDDEIKEIFRSRGISDVVDLLEEEYSTDDIIFELGENEVLDYFDDESLYDKIENSCLMQDVKEELKNEAYHEYIDEWIEDLDQKNKSFLEELRNAYPDDIHKFICNLINCGYCDQEEFNKKLEDFKEKLNKNSYGIKYE